MDEKKIYTRKGDTGETSLLGGTRVIKNHPRIEAYGTVDELNAQIGLLHSLFQDKRSRKALLVIQEKLFIAESNLAAEKKELLTHIPRITPSDIEFLEKEIDAMNEELPALKNFILPSGHYLTSLCHVARCVCRRAERISIELLTKHPFDEVIIRYLNRLSDYLFVLARYAAKINNADEVTWISK